MKMLKTREGLEILALWLQDNISLESELIFDNEEDQTTSEQLLPCVEDALNLLPVENLAAREGEVVPAGMSEVAAIAVSADFIPGGEPDNNGRAALAAEVLCLFATRTGMGRSGEHAETIMVDLLADLMHLADSLGVPHFGHLVATASMHHEAEICTMADEFIDR
ncbi:DUF957 domain-containing protein [Salmonella enterica subsp. enterica]|nr:DUF957 domain-containing protein [Salmonella enterica subsp. enterica]MIF52427.1 DUF957 domain-containing protein [Salmonella enterica subsp. enterica]